MHRPTLLAPVLIFCIPAMAALAAAAQVEFESKCSKQCTILQFQALSSRCFNVGLMGSTCTALPRRAQQVGAENSRRSRRLFRKRLKPGAYTRSLFSST